MDVLFSVKNKWTSLIKNNEKCYEFRKKLPKHLNINDKIYIYETGYKNGSKKVIGEAIVKKIIPIAVAETNSRLGCYPFLKFFINNIAVFDSEEEKEIVKTNIDKIYKTNITGYYQESMLHFLFLTEHLDNMIKKDNPDAINIYNMIKKDNQEDFENYRKMKFKAQLLLEQCDNWLNKMGFYYSEGYQDDETSWKYAIYFENFKLYSKPKDINQFINSNNKNLTVAPQSWCYVKEQITDEAISH